MKPLESAALPDHPDTGTLSPQRLESDPLAESTEAPPRDQATLNVPMRAVWAAPKVRLDCNPLSLCEQAPIGRHSETKRMQTAPTTTAWPMRRTKVGGTAFKQKIFKRAPREITDD